MIVKLWFNFSKRHNSTLRPSTNADDTITVRLKENTSKENPVFILQNPSFPQWNYAQWDDHYYFIDDIVSISNGVYEVHCSQDLLATYKSFIGAYNCYVERAASSYNSYIEDNHISQEYDVAYYNKKAFIIPNYEAANGCYVVRVVGFGGVNSFALSSTQLYNLLSFMFNDANFGDVFTDLVTTAVFNPFQYVTSIMWFPFATGTISAGSSRRIYLGWYNSGVDAPLVYDNGYNTSVDVVTGGGYYNDFRDWSPAWTSCTIYLPGCGDINVNVMSMRHRMRVELNVDLYTGACEYTLLSYPSGSGEEEDATVVSVIDGRMGVPIQIGQTQVNASGVLQSITAATSSAVSFTIGDVGGGVSGVVSAVNGIMNIAQPTPSLLGTQGNKTLLKYNPNITVSITRLKSADIPQTVDGRPLCRNVTLSSLSGYIKCGNASIALPALSNDRAQVNAFLNSGFYYE